MTCNSYNAVIQAMHFRVTGYQEALL